MRVIAIVAWALVLAAAQPAQEPEAIPDFGREYAELTVRQKALIDDLFRRFTAVSGVAATEPIDKTGVTMADVRFLFSSRYLITISARSASSCA